MKSSGKKIGGVKNRTTGTSPTKSRTTDSPKKIGGVKTVPRGMSNNGVESCPENCPGEYVEGMWIHSKTCPWAAVLWNAHGKTVKDWHCMYDCDPMQLPSGWTHPMTCPFWDRTGRTPFDHPKPDAAKLITQPTKSWLESVVQMKNTEKERLRRAREAAENPQPFSEFPRALSREESDDLPF
jgi:hypothetical protein